MKKKYKQSILNGINAGIIIKLLDYLNAPSFIYYILGLLVMIIYYEFIFKGTNNVLQ